MAGRSQFLRPCSQRANGQLRRTGILPVSIIEDLDHHLATGLFVQGLSKSVEINQPEIGRMPVLRRWLAQTLFSGHSRERASGFEQGLIAALLDNASLREHEYPIHVRQ